MTDHHDNDDMLQQVRHALDDSVDNLDELTRARLQAARKRAVDSVGQRHGWRTWLPLHTAVALPAGAVAMLLVAILAVQVYRTPPAITAPDAEVMEMLSAVDDLEMLQNMEFYEWLESHEAAAG